ncbi:hypothetical protein EI77_03755 [Prosthecobacter fusiformis]|uniref:BNR repeat protein n=1 Tax=Prosthecobacter fusiformis TaxID=48464 RepID=A0A4R7RM44_9BACT|nr:hypothetical protein [Prosthecobacter fusiformis]TDU66019.1 hypothetical protein EI77_03755 [Prosthecobacter fusiformis]
MKSQLPCFIALGLLLSAATAMCEEMPKIVLDDLPLLFVDDSGIASRQGVIITLHRARTRAEPVMQPELPWEGSRIYVYGSVYYDEAAQSLSLWYMGHPDVDAQGNKPKVPGFRAGKGDMVLYATSKDGLAWQRPQLGLHSFQGSTANNIVFDMHSPSVLLDKRDPDPSRRYKMLGSLRGAYYAAVSADGINWKRFPDDRPVLKSSDNICLTQDPLTGEYLAYHRQPANKHGRSVSLSRSRDFQTWSEPELTFLADKDDHAWAKNADERTEVNNLSVYPHASGFIGLPTIFRVLGKDAEKTEVKPGQSPTDGIIEVQLITSADGLTWQRTDPRISLIPRGEPGSFDGGTILGVSSTCVHVKDETWIYYTALTTSHGAPIPPKMNAIGRAEWRRHGFVSLDAGQNGLVETRPLQLGGPALIINANAAGGEIRAALLEADGRPIEGYTAEDCEPLRENQTKWQVRWQASGSALPQGRPLKVRLQMRQSRLYSLSCGT